MKFSRSLLVLVLLACTLGAFGQSPRSDIVTLQSAAAATGNGTALDVGLYGGVAVQITGTFSATVTFEATIDRTNWIAVKADNLNDRTSATTATAAGIFQVPLSGAVQFRARISAYTSGSVTVKARGVAGQISLKQSSGGGGGGSGTVTDFSAGDLSPLFTTSEATTTTTPALSFSLSNALAHKFFGNNTGSTGAPDFVSIGTGDLPSGIPYANLNLTGAILNADLSGHIANAKLANSAITIAGSSTSLGGSISLDTIDNGLAATGLIARTAANTRAARTITGTSNQITVTNGDGVSGNPTLATPQDIGTSSNVRFGNLGLNVAAPASAGMIASTLGANNITGLLIKRNTDSAPTGKFFDFQNAAGTTVASMGIDGALTVASCSGCGGASFANPSASVGLTAVNGSASTAMRSDAAPALDVTIAPTWSGAHTFANTIALSSTTAANNKITQGAALNLGTTSTDGIILQNTTAAAAGAQQYSPRLRLTGSGWKTNATAGAQTVDWIVENQPVQGAANPTSNLVISSQVNGGGYTGLFSIGSNGLVTIGNSGTTVAGITLLGSGGLNSTISVTTGQRLLIAGIEATGNLVFGNGFATLSAASGLTSLTTAGTSDIRLVPTSRNLIIGTTDAASPGAQTLSVQNVVAGTSNTAGATWTHTASLGTSQGAPGRFHIQTGGMIAASGTTQQTAVNRAIFGATKVLTNNSATTVANVTVASNTSAGGTLDYVVEVFDGTDLQYETGTVAFGITNKGGAFSGNTTTKAVNQQNATSGTLTVTWAISAANPGVLSVNANSSLTPSTGYPRVTYNLRSGSQQSISIQ